MIPTPPTQTPTEGKIISDRKITPQEFYRRIGYSFFWAVVVIGSLFAAGVAYQQYALNQNQNIPVVNPADLPPLSTDEVAVYRDSIKRVYLVTEIAEDTATTTTASSSIKSEFIDFGETAAEEVIDIETLKQTAPVSTIIPAGAVSLVAPIVTTGEGSAVAQEPLTIYIEGDAMVSDAAIEQPNRQNTTEVNVTAVVADVSNDQGRLLVTIDGEVNDILMDNSKITTTEGRFINLSDIRVNDVLVVKGQKMLEAPVIRDAVMQLVGVQEFIPTMDLGI